MPEMDAPPRYSNKWDRMTYLLKAYRLPITALLAVVGVIIWMDGAPQIQIPGWVRPLALGVVYGAVPAYVVGVWIVSKFFPDPREEVLELNLNDEGGAITAKSWFVPSDIWASRQRGERPALKPDVGATAVVTELENLDDVNKISVEGCNKEIADPVSIVSRQGRLEQIENTLIPKAEEKDKLEATVRTRALDIQSDNIHALLAAVESGTQMDPTAVSKAFEDDLVSFDSPDAEQRENAEPDPENGQGAAEMELLDLIGSE